jgi:hypothetical protein
MRGIETQADNSGVAISFKKRGLGHGWCSASEKGKWSNTSWLYLDTLSSAAVHWAMQAASIDRLNSP